MYYIIPYYIISYYIILYYIILYHIISYYIILYHIILYHIKSYYIILYHIISYYIILYHIISYQISILYHNRNHIYIYIRRPPRCKGSAPKKWGWDGCGRHHLADEVATSTEAAPGNGIIASSFFRASERNVRQFCGRWFSQVWA